MAREIGLGDEEEEEQEEKEEEPKPDQKAQTTKETTKKYELYEKDGEKVKRSRKSCPRCGPGVFLADHGNRYSCGKCGYTEFKNSDSE